MRIIKCWGIPYGKFNLNTQEITIEAKGNSIQEFKNNCEIEGHVLTSEPYYK